jgi:cytochrome oxidase assembly protein ShyY1
VARDAAIRLVETNYDSTPVPLADLLPSTDAALDPDDVWRQVTVQGRYDTDATVLLRNRPVDSQPGFHVLVPLVLTSAGSDADPVVLVVDRGWVAWDEDASGEVDVPAPPAGEVAVTVRMRQDEPASDRSAPAGQVQAIHVAQVLAAGDLDATSYRAYGAVVSEQPAAGPALGRLPAPSTDPGSHLSYAFQWWTFALGALIGFTWMARRELRDGRALAEAAALAAEQGAAQPGADAAPPTAPAARRQRRRPSDEETEDALIDAQS